MTRKQNTRPLQSTSTLQHPSGSSGTPLAGLFAAALLVLLGSIIAAPVVTGVAVFSLLVAVVGYRRLKGHLRTAARETQSVTLPGIGTLRYRIRPR